MIPQPGKIEQAISTFKESTREIVKEVRNRRFHVPENERRTRKHLKAVERQQRYFDDCPNEDPENEFALEDARIEGRRRHRAMMFAPRGRAISHTWTRSPSTEGAMEIVVTQEWPPLFTIFLDKTKRGRSGRPEKYGFPFGGKNDPERKIIDANIDEAGRREAKEEIGLAPGVGVQHFIDSFTAKNLDGSHREYEISVFLRIVPPDPELKEGKEVVRGSLELVTRERIEQLRKDPSGPKFLDNHYEGLIILEASLIYQQFLADCKHLAE